MCKGLIQHFKHECNNNELHPNQINWRGGNFSENFEVKLLLGLQYPTQTVRTLSVKYSIIYPIFPPLILQNNYQ